MRAVLASIASDQLELADEADLAALCQMLTRLHACLQGARPGPT